MGPNTILIGNQSSGEGGDKTERPLKMAARKGNTQQRLQLEHKENGGRTWANMVEENKLATKGMELRFVPPTIINGEKFAELTHEDVKTENEKWKFALIGYMVGDTPTIAAMERYVAVQGNFETKPKIYYHNAGYFVINFSCEEDKSQLLCVGPHMMNNRPIILKPRTSDFNFDEEELKTILILVKLPNLPLSCWSPIALSKIGSGLGLPLYADDCTTNSTRISYATILVEIDVTRELSNIVKVKDPQGRMFEQALWYDWKPIYCPKCLQIGHKCQTEK
ncbi:uncharacterized protein LOC142162812 [Nicotiana tabacum]|uniref:Uncharacterized protein LOC142162812 n=1 Tax=Nicotiana tabacum TaxID=4097 RepID=A0AC58RST2_TOBAC